MIAHKHLEHTQVPNTFLQSCSKNSADEEMYTAADAIIKNLAVEFVERLPGELLKIGEAMAELEAAPAEKALFKTLFCLVHDLKGMAGTFDYLLITAIGNDLCRFIEHSRPLMPSHIKVMRLYVEALNTVAEKGISGDGGETGVSIMDGLHLMASKALQKD